MFYAQINLTTRIVEAETMSHSPIAAPHMVEITEEQYGTTLGKIHDEQTGDFEPVAPPVPTNSTKRAFQNRFPKAANGISTKWDVMSLFLVDDGYAASLGVTGAPLYELRLLITTGQQRLQASPFVSMTPGGEADIFTQLLVNPAIPAAFRITAGERTAMLTDPLLPEETYKG